MMYFRQILVPLVLLLVAGGTLAAQTDIPWTRVYDSPQKSAGIMTVALDPAGGVYVGRLGSGVDYAPPSSGAELGWRALDREHLPTIPPQSLQVTPTSIATSPAGSGALYMIATGAGRGYQMFRYSWSESRWVLDSAEPRNTSMRKLMIDMGENIFGISETGMLFRRKPQSNVWENIPLSSFRVQNVILGDSNALFAAVEGEGVMRSRDGGDSWTRLSVPGDSSWRTAPLLGSGPDGRIYALWRDLWRLDDNGETWTLIPNRPPTGCAGIAGGSRGEIYFLSSNDMHGGGGLYMTTDDGATWTQPVPELKNSSVGGLAVGEYVYAGGGSQLVRSGDGGRTWEDAYIPAVSRVDAFNGLVAAVDQGRLWKSFDESGAAWKPQPLIDISAIRIEGSRGILAGVHGKLIRVPIFGAGGGSTLAFPESAGIHDIEVDSRGVIYVLSSTAEGNRRVSISSDEGVSWEYRSRVPFRAAFTSLAIDRENNLYAVADSSYIFRLAADGAAWTLFSDLTGKGPVRGMAIHPSGNPVVIGSDWIGYCHPESSRVDVQTVAGTELFDIAFAPDGYGVVAGSDGVLFSGDGRTWKPSTTWRDSVGAVSGNGAGEALCVAIDERGTCYVGTRGRGIWYGPAGSISSAGGGRDHQSIPASLSLSLAPNPAAGHLALRYMLPEGGDATVVLHDLLGRPVLAVAAAGVLPGEQRTILDLHGVPAGTYIVTVKTGGTIRASAPVIVTGR